MSPAFELHPRLAADTSLVDDWPLCRLLLMNDARFPWFILVPRRRGLREIFELSENDQVTLVRESSRLARAISAAFSPDKLNIAALGNVVPQLHLHHIGRRVGDPMWPAPVWGSPGQPYTEAARGECLERLRATL